MDISVFNARQLDTVFRALRTALAPTGDLLPEERVFLETYAQITGFALTERAPEPIGAGEVQIEGARQQKRLVQLAAMAALLHRPVRPESVAFVTELDRHLGVGEAVIPVLDALQKGRKMKARMLTARRGFKMILREARQAEGMMGILRFLSALFFQVRVNKDKHLKYKRLGLLPEGTLGREVWKHITELGYGFPGEPAGIAETMVYHDVGHVLFDNDTSATGEIQQGALQGGNRRQDGFVFVQFVLLQFHHGIKITPVAPGQVGYFDPRKVLWAIHRGATCNVDITHQWDFWPLMPLPISQVREQTGMLPKLA